MTTLTDQTSVRGISSKTARCPRQGAYAALATGEDEERYDVSLYYRRGEVFERLRAAEYEAIYGKDDIERQRLVHWTAGGKQFAGAIDIYIKSLKRIVEVVSAVGPTMAVYGRKIDQARFYGCLDPDCESVVVDVIDPSKLAPAESIPVTITDEDRADVQHAIEQVHEALVTQGDVMPERVCSHPREARDHLCPFAATCFAQFVEPVLRMDDPEAENLAARAYSAYTSKKIKDAEAEIADERWKEAAGHLREYVPEGKTEVGEYFVTRTPVKGRTTFQFSLAVKAGAVNPAEVSEFVKVGEPHERWDIRLGNEP